MGTVKTTAALEQSCLGSAQSCSSSPSLWCSARTWAHPWTIDLSKLIAMSWRICPMRLAEPEWHIPAQTNLPQAMKRSVTHGCYNIWIPVRQPTVVSVSSSWLQRRICATLQTSPKNCATPYIVSTVSCSMPDRPFANDPTAGAAAVGGRSLVAQQEFLPLAPAVQQLVGSLVKQKVSSPVSKECWVTCHLAPRVSVVFLVAA